ncbi:MAG: GEVED domain-containing protein [Flavobacteriales bacterium]
MKKAILSLFAGVLSFTAALHAQVTVVINTGTAGTPAYNAGPIYRSASSSAYDASRYSYLYTAAELAAVGISSGDVITSLGWMKANNATSASGATFRIFMKNSATATYGNASETWANLNAGTTMVFEDLNYTVPATQTPNYIPFVLNTPFVYTGGSLEISTEWDINMVSGTASTDAFDWEWSTVPNAIYGTGQTILANAGTLSATTNSISAIDDRRPFLQITYTPGTACSGQPTGGTLNVSSNTVCPTVPVNFSVSGSSLGSGMTYQWQSSANGIVWNDIPGATGFAYTSTISTPLNYRRRMICTAGPDTAYSTSQFVDVSPFYNCYCTSNATAATNNDIGLVEIAGLSNNSSIVVGNCEQYSDYTSLPATPLFISVNNNVKITTTDCEGSSFSSRAVVVFIDYNHDGDFTGADERVFFTPTATGALTVDHTGSFAVPATAMLGVTRMRVITSTTSGATQSPCGTYTNGETEDYLVDIQPQPANEVALVSIDAPVPASCSLGNQILVTLKNNGTAAITSLAFDINSGGLLINNVAWTGSIAPGATQQVQVPGTYVFNDGDSLHLTVKNPNGSADIMIDNSAGFRHYLSLSGEYKVGYGVTNLATREFADITVAVLSAYQRGVCDTVYFNIKDGTYTDRFLLSGDYFDYNPGDMVVFRSETKNASALIIQQTGTAAADNYLVRLDNTHGWGFEHITFRPLGTTYRSAIDILGSSGTIFVDSCRFIGDPSTTGMTSLASAAAAVKTASSSVQSDISVTNSFMQDFAIGGYFYGSSTTAYENNIVFENNELVKMHAAGFYGYYLNRPVFRNNKVVMDTIAGGGATTQYGMYMYYINGGEISGNHFISNDVTYSLYLNDVQGDVNPFLVANNFIYNSYAAGNAAAIRSTSSANNRIDFINNSISHRSTSTSYAVVDLSSGKNMRLINNIIANTGTAALIEAPTAATLYYSNHNNWHNPNGQLGNVSGSVYADLSALQAGTAYDAASLSVDPQFNNEDLHTCATALDAAGEAVALTLDFDGDVRNASTPDIGADEFMGANDALLTNDYFEKCPSAAVSFGAAQFSGVTYTWAPGGGNTPNITVTAPGQYIVSAIGVCGTFMDTVTVVDKAAPVAGFNIASTVSLAVELNNTSSNAIGYLWDFGDGNTSTDENPTHIYTSGNVYVITLTVYGECDTVTTTQTASVVASGLAEIEGGTITLYPNPAADLLNLRFTAELNGNVQTDILDMSGKIVYNSNFALTSGGTQTMDVQSLKPGVYHVRIRMNDAQKVLKFVKK